jgi:RNA polymerase sigma-70 factor (ECF subfamily)
MDPAPPPTPENPSRPSSISSTLLEQLRARRPEAWQRLVLLYGPVIYHWCRRSSLAAEDAADVVQEVLSAVLIHLPGFRRDRPQDSFSGWLAAITRNKVRENYRRRQGRAEARGGSTALRQMAEIAEPECLPSPSGKEAGGEGESIQPDDQAAACLSRRVLDAIRAEFEDRTWQAFWRVSAGGESPAHVAADLSMSVAAVYKAKSRVLARFRQMLSELPE